MITNSSSFIEKQIELIESYPDSERIEWLRSREWYREIHEKINQKLREIVPDTHIVTTPCVHIPDYVILEHGKIFEIPSILFSFENARCHDNCFKLYAQNEISNICIGYALSSDGLWRYHSWGLDFDNYIIETTQDRLLYFGIAICKTREKIINQ